MKEERFPIALLCFLLWLLLLLSIYLFCYANRKRCDTYNCSLRLNYDIASCFHMKQNTCRTTEESSISVIRVHNKQNSLHHLLQLHVKLGWQFGFSKHILSI